MFVSSIIVRWMMFNKALDASCAGRLMIDTCSNMSAVSVWEGPKHSEPNRRNKDKTAYSLRTSVYCIKSGAKPWVM